MSDIVRAAQAINAAQIESARDLKFPNPRVLAQSLADAGLLAPDLPEPTLSDYYRPEWNVFDTTIWTQTGMVYCRDVDHTEWEAAPGDVIAFAHALLAAAAHATQEKK